MTETPVIGCPACGRRFRFRGAVPNDCPNCRQPLEVAEASPTEPDAAPAGRRRRGGVPEDLGVRRAAERAVSTAVRNLGMIRYGLVGSAVLSGGLALLLLVGKARGLPLIVLAAVCVASVVGAVRVLREPLLWTTLNAVLATPMGVMGLISVLESGSVSGALIVLAVFGYWMSVLMAARLQRTLRKYPDLYSARAMRGESTGRHSERSRVEVARRRRRTLLLAVGVPAGFALLVVLFVALRGRGSSGGTAEVPPPNIPFELTEARWRRAWNADDVAGVKGLLAGSERASRGAFLDRQIAKRSWKPLPPLSPPRVEPSGEHRRVASYDLSDKDIDLTVYWEWESTAWVVVNWSFPNR